MWRGFAQASCTRMERGSSLPLRPLSDFVAWVRRKCPESPAKPGGQTLGEYVPGGLPGFVEGPMCRSLPFATTAAFPATCRASLTAVRCLWPQEGRQLHSRLAAGLR